MFTQKTKSRKREKKQRKRSQQKTRENEVSLKLLKGWQKKKQEKATEKYVWRTVVNKTLEELFVFAQSEEPTMTFP